MYAEPYLTFACRVKWVVSLLRLIVSLLDIFHGLQTCSQLGSWQMTGKFGSLIQHVTVEI